MHERRGNAPRTTVAFKISPDGHAALELSLHWHRHQALPGDGRGASIPQTARARKRRFRVVTQRGGRSWLPVGIALFDGVVVVQVDTLHVGTRGTDALGQPHLSTLMRTAS